jgi:hypothetical protein
MGLPSDLVSKSQKVLKRPTPPTTREMLVGDRLPPLSDSQKEGTRLMGALGARYLQEAEALHVAREQERKATLKAETDAILARYDKRLSEAGQ